MRDAGFRSLLLHLVPAVLVLSLVAASESRADETQTASTSHAGHITTPFDTIPDFAASPTVVSVKSGNWSDPSVWSSGALPGPNDVVLVKHQVVYNSTSSSVKTLAIATGASWSCALTQNTRLSVGTLQAQPGSTLKCGTAAAPLPATFKAEIIIRNLSLQTNAAAAGVFDPSQYGTGVLAIDAKVQLHGAPIADTFLRLAAEPLAGSRTLMLSDVPMGWRAGDEVVLPDTRQLAAADLAPRPEYPATAADSIRRRVSQSETAIIQSIAGAVVTLSAPLQFDHRGARDADGLIQLLPHAGNLSRNIVIRSENPAGTRGHMLVTRASDVDIRYVRFADLGRTTSELLDSTAFNAAGVVTRVGQNQIGRYPLHVHHVPGICPAGEAQFTVLGNAIANSRKWGIAIHGSHFGLVQGNVVFETTGAGIATEDGSETGNVFERNFLVKSEAAIRHFNGESADPLGRKGNGFWMRGPNNILRDNVIAEAKEGIGYFSGSDETGAHANSAVVRIPSFQCADTTVAGQYTTAQIAWLSNPEVTGNEIYSTSDIGFGSWFYHQTSDAKARIPIRDTTIWHTLNQGMFLRYWNGAFDGLRMLNEGGVGTAIAQFNDDGVDPHSELYRANIQGYDRAFERVGQLALAASWLVQDSSFRNVLGFHLNAAGQGNHNGASRFTFRNVRFSPLPGRPLNSFVLTEPGSDYNNEQKIFEVYGYQGNPADNFRLYYTSQATGVKYQAVAPCTSVRPEIGGLVCPIAAAPPVTSTPSVPPVVTPTPPVVTPTPPVVPVVPPVAAPVEPPVTPPPTVPSVTPPVVPPVAPPVVVPPVTPPVVPPVTTPPSATPSVPPAVTPAMPPAPVVLSDQCTPAAFEMTATQSIIFAVAPTDASRLYVCGGSFAAEATGTMNASWLGWAINATANRDVPIPVGLAPAGVDLMLKWTSAGKATGWISVRLAP